jgi:hypothetical protein
MPIDDETTAVMTPGLGRNEAGLDFLAGSEMGDRAWGSRSCAAR